MSQTFVGFPLQATWIDDINRLSNSGQLLLDIAGQVLDSFPADEGDTTRGSPYVRRVLSTGEQVPLVPQEDGQLAVSCYELTLGRAGEQRFQFFKGDMGSYAQRVASFKIILARSSPSLSGGIAPRMQRATDLGAAAAELWTDAYIVWSAMLATALGGVFDTGTRQQISPAPITQDNLMVGPMTFEPPQGGLAIAAMEVQIQL